MQLDDCFMKRFLRHLLVVMIMAFLLPGCSAESSKQKTQEIQPLRINTGSLDSSLGKLAVKELVTYSEKIFTNPVVFSR